MRAKGRGSSRSAPPPRPSSPPTQTTLALGNARAAGWKRSHDIFVRNVSTRRLRVRVRFEPYAQGAAPVKFRAFPPRFTIPIREDAARTRRLVDQARAGRRRAGGGKRRPRAVRRRSASSSVGGDVRAGAGAVLGPLRLSTDSFTPSDAGPALLTFRAGQLVTEAGATRSSRSRCSRSSCSTRTENELGTLVTLRDLLPGRYAFGLTGRTPAGNTLGSGRYRIRVTASAESRRSSGPRPGRRSRSNRHVYSPRTSPSRKRAPWRLHRLPSRIFARTRLRSHASS